MGPCPRPEGRSDREWSRRPSNPVESHEREETLPSGEGGPSVCSFEFSCQQKDMRCRMYRREIRRTERPWKRTAERSRKACSWRSGSCPERLDRGIRKHVTRKQLPKPSAPTSLRPEREMWQGTPKHAPRRVCHAEA